MDGASYDDGLAATCMQAPLETLRAMEKCARALARAVGYSGAATVEYLYALETKEYYFLELNPRLQVSPAKTSQLSLTLRWSTYFSCHLVALDQTAACHEGSSRSDLLMNLIERCTEYKMQ